MICDQKSMLQHMMNKLYPNCRLNKFFSKFLKNMSRRAFSSSRSSLSNGMCSTASYLTESVTSESVREKKYRIPLHKVKNFREASKYCRQTQPVNDFPKLRANTIERYVQLDQKHNIESILAQKGNCSLFKDYVVQAAHKPLSLLSLAARCGSLKCFKFLLSKKFAITEDVCIQAILGGNLGILEMCYKARVCDFKKLMNYAIEHRQHDVVDWICKNYGTEPVIDIIQAARCGNNEAVYYYLSHRGYTEVRDRDGSTALHWACIQGEFFTSIILIDRGAKLNTLNNGNFTPLHYAIKRGHWDIARMLVERGADLNVKNCYGHTPLGLALDVYTHLRQELIDLLTPAPVAVKDTICINQPDKMRRKMSSPMKPEKVVTTSQEPYVFQKIDKGPASTNKQYTKYSQQTEQYQEKTYKSVPTLVHETTRGYDSLDGRRLGSRSSFIGSTLNDKYYYIPQYNMERSSSTPMGLSSTSSDCNKPVKFFFTNSYCKPVLS